MKAEFLTAAEKERFMCTSFDSQFSFFDNKNGRNFVFPVDNVMEKNFS